MTATVSVIIPTYNDGKYLSRAVESVLKQKRAPEELIVVDDGSDNDHFATAVCSFRQEGTAIRFARKPNGGAASARNHGLGMARMNHVAFLDADDWWGPEFLSSKFAFLDRARHPEASYAGIYGSYIDVKTGRRGKFRNVDGCANADLLGKADGIPGGAPMFVFSHDALRRVGGFDEGLKINEDFDLIARLLKAGGFLLGSAGATYMRNNRPGSLTRTTYERCYPEIEKFLDKAEAKELLSGPEIRLRRKYNRLRLAKDYALRGRSPRRAAELCHLAFTYAKPSGSVERVLFFASTMHRRLL